MALTDHNTVEGALRLKDMEPELTIVGEEIKTTEGEIIGLFLNHGIARDLPPETVLDLIHEQGGLAYLAHPLDPWRYHFSVERVRQLAPMVDIIEGYNTHCPEDRNAAAKRLAGDLGLPWATGSDSHSIVELGYAWQEMPGFSGPNSFLASLEQAQSLVLPRPPELRHRP